MLELLVALALVVVMSGFMVGGLWTATRALEADRGSSQEAEANSAIESLRDFVVPTALPGVKVNTSETENMIWTQMRLQRWTGSAWEAFGDVLDAKSD